MKEAAVILAGTGFLTAICWSELPLAKPDCGAEPSVIRYLPMPEPAPLKPAPAWDWPIEERMERVAAVEEPQEQPEPQKRPPAIEADEPRHRRHRHHWRRRR